MLIAIILSQLSSNFLGWIFFIVYILSFILFAVFLIKSLIDHSDFYKTIGKDLGAGDYFIYLVMGLPFYLFMYFYYRNEMKEEMKMIN